jgi:diguanylate cyclase (GGDEF)-like protein
VVASNRAKKTILLVWLLIVPAGMWFTYTTYPPHLSGRWPDILAFLLLTSIVAAMPMVINNTPIFLTQWVLLASFLSFGLFAEMVFSQVAIIVLLLKLRVQKDQLFRFPLNWIMFFFVSFCSGTVYYLLGGEMGVDIIDHSRSLWLAVLYVVLNYTSNQVIVSIYIYVIYRSKVSFLDKDFMVETITYFITFPIGFVLYILYNKMGLLAILFVGVPFVSLSIIFNLYYSSQKINEYLQKAAEIGHKMAEQLQVGAVIDLFIQKLIEMLPVDYAYILEVVEGNELKLTRRIENGEIVINDMPNLKENEGISGTVLSTKRSLLFSSSKEWFAIGKGYIPNDAESILSVPIVRSQEVIGVIVLASRRKRAFEKYQLMIVDILCSYFAVALENARHYELTKMQSERCSLTKLYNYRYFENLLHEEFNKLFNFERRILSLIILDIDHFKAVNDSYGHQSGNEILIELAVRVSKLVGGRGTVARYGGEEFVVLLPDASKEEAYQMAEHIRQSIANWPFMLTQSLDPEQKQAYITASIGVATAPENAEDALALIRHADRALYVGAKRAGRNRVAEYSK